MIYDKKGEDVVKENRGEAVLADEAKKQAGKLKNARCWRRSMGYNEAWRRTKRIRMRV